MNQMYRRMLAAILIGLSLTPLLGLAVTGWASSRVTEDLNRGIVAFHNGTDAYVSWRLLDTDSQGIDFDLYRAVGAGSAVKLNGSPIAQTTDYVDTGAPTGVNLTYYVVPYEGGVAQSASETVTINSASSKNYISIEIGETVGKVGIGDLDGDGAYDYVVRCSQNNIDPHSSNWHASGSAYKLKAYKSDGTLLWTYDMGFNIESGVWYSPFIVYDFDGDGKAEVAAKTAPLSPDYRDSNGRVQSGPEYLSIIDGTTGQIVDSIDWPSRTGYANYNEASRNQIGLAFLDGKTPCIIAARGTYDLMKANAFQFNPGTDELELLWSWDSTSETASGQWDGQGAHSMHCADVDGDGRDEVILGSCTLDDDGTGLWTNGLDHCDHAYVGDLDPNRPGMEIYFGYETGRTTGEGVSMWDAATGQMIWKLANDATTNHIHREGLVSDIDPNYPGAEAWSGEQSYSTRYFHSADGQAISHNGLFFDDLIHYRAAYWDADLQREVLVGRTLYSFPENAVSSVYYEPFDASSSVNDWSITSGDSQAIVEFNNDNKALRIKQTGTAAWTLSADSVISVTPGETYRVVATGWLLDAGSAQVSFNVAGYDGSTLTVASMVAGTPTLNEAKPCEFTASFTVPSGVDGALLQFTGDAMGSSGRLYINDIRLLVDDNPGRAAGTVQGDDLLWVDAFGDWREEIVTLQGTELRIYFTDIPAADRRVSLMQDSIYRADVAHAAMGYAQVPTTSYNLAQPTNPIGYVYAEAYWPFDNNADDLSGHNLHGTLQNGATFSTDSVTGSHSLSLDGTNDYVLISAESGSDYFHEAIAEKTVFCWIKPASLSGTQIIYEEGDSTAGIALRIHNGSIQAGVADGSNLETISAALPAANEWTSVAVVYDNDILTLYINGIQAGAPNDTGFGLIPAHSGATAVGSTQANSDAFGGTSGNYFQGLIDDLTVFSDALTAAEMLQLGGVVTSVTLTPSDDAMTRGGTYASQNFGSDSQLASKNGSSSVDRRAFLKFDLSQIPAGISPSQFKIRLWSESSASPSLSVSATSDSWSEGTITWNNMPDYGSTLDVTNITTQNTWQEFDVTAEALDQLAGDGVLSIALVNTNSQLAAFSSKEGTYAPQLVVTGYEVNSGPIEMEPSADTYIRGGTYSNNNYGSETVLSNKNSSSNTDRRPFLKFDLTQLPSGQTINQAKLAIYVASGSGTTNRVHFVSDDTWTESGITWSNAPSHDSSELDSVTISASGVWVEYDVTSAAQSEYAGDGVLSLTLQTSSSTMIDYASWESGTSPLLIIE